jgi:hypothetical protein
VAERVTDELVVEVAIGLLRTTSCSLAPCSKTTWLPVDPPGLVTPVRSSVVGGPTARIEPFSPSSTGSEIHWPASIEGKRLRKPFVLMRIDSGSPLRSSVRSMKLSASGHPLTHSTMPSSSTSRPRLTERGKRSNAVAPARIAQARSLRTRNFPRTLPGQFWTLTGTEPASINEPLFCDVQLHN